MIHIPLAVQFLYYAPIAAILLGFFVFRPYFPTKTHWPILASCAVVSFCAVAIAHWTATTGYSFDQNLWRWAAAGKWGVDFGLRMDGLGAAILAMVAVVGSLIHVYAAGYMKGDPGFSRFFLVFHLFFLAMIGLVTANNYVQFYLCWELVGVCSYFLIGFWFTKESARKAALRAFMTNRIGDFGFLVAMLMILATFRVAHFHLIYVVVDSAARAGHLPETLPAIGALLIWAACAKSAQFPLHFWLPDAMEGPTPTSALMHAATMVTAGVILLVRSWPLIAAVPALPPLVAGIGAFTAVAAALIAATRRDLKRILAYSTVSHLGLMMLALGLGHVGLAVFHLIVHGFFKAALFLCAGNIAHALHQPTASVDDVGGWRRALPLTYVCFWVAALSLAGVWPLGGFFSKDAILDAAWEHGGILALVSPLISFGSAFYIFRMLFLTFFGDRPEQKQLSAHPHEAGAGLVAPIALICIGAAGVGFFGGTVERLIIAAWRELPLGIPGLNGRINLPGATEIPRLGLSAMFGRGGLFAALGAGAAWVLTLRDAGWDWRWRRSAPRLEKVFDAEFGWRPLVALAADGVAGAADFIGAVFDKKWWDGLLESSAGALSTASDRLAELAGGRLNDYLWWMAAGAAALLGRALR